MECTQCRDGLCQAIAVRRAPTWAIRVMPMTSAWRLPKGLLQRQKYRFAHPIDLGIPDSRVITVSQLVHKMHAQDVGFRLAP